MDHSLSFILLETPPLFLMKIKSHNMLMFYILCMRVKIIYSGGLGGGFKVNLT